jgi:FkbM family methyltransferase
LKNNGSNNAFPNASEAPLLLRILGRISRATPYFKGKWRIMDWIFARWFIKRRVWTDVQLNIHTTIVCNLWDYVQFGIWWGGETYEIKQTLYFKSLLRPGSVVFDIGANVGYYSLIAAPLVYPNGSVYAFEPVSQQFELLQENAKRNGFSQIFPHKIALSDKSGDAVIHLEDEFNTGLASLRSASRTKLDEIVSCVTLDDFVQSQALDRLDVIKIDVEGHESAVLNGGHSTLERFHPVLLVEIKESIQRLAGFSRQKLFEWLMSRDYLPFRIESDARLVSIKEPEDGMLIVFRHASQLR